MKGKSAELPLVPGLLDYLENCVLYQYCCAKDLTGFYLSPKIGNPSVRVPHSVA